jgi:hypothetical protein
MIAPSAILLAAISALMPTSPSAALINAQHAMTAHRLRSCIMKKAPDERPDEGHRPKVNIDMLSIVEFHDAKHGSGACPSVLGLIKGIEHKAKGGARLKVVDASGTVHMVPEKSIHVNLGCYKGKLVEPEAILADYQSVLELEPTKIGVEPDVLEMAWELASEEDKTSVSPRYLFSLIDDSLFKSQIGVYKAFRLLTSDLGKVFFKAVSSNEYKPKASKSVQASKENWCRDREADAEEWCFV